jgi:hypothetical protein
MPANVKTYQIGDPEALAAKVKAMGGPQLDPTQPTGEAAADGVHISWTIQGDTIQITIVSKPWIIPYSTIWSNIDHVFNNPS